MTVTESHSEAETIDLGRQYAGRLTAGDVVALYGELGAGKTCFIKGIAQGLGVTQDVTSPTFTIIHEYRGGSVPLYHVDLYRLDSLAQILAVGIEDYLNQNGVTVIEWAEKMESLLPQRTRRVHMSLIDETTRRIEIT